MLLAYLYSYPHSFSNMQRTNKSGYSIEFLNKYRMSGIISSLKIQFVVSVNGKENVNFVIFFFQRRRRLKKLAEEQKKKDQTFMTEEEGKDFLCNSISFWPNVTM